MSDKFEKKPYTFEVKVSVVSFHYWLAERESRGSVVGLSAEMDLDSTFGFKLPPEKLIIAGLKHIGLMYRHGVVSFHIKNWSDDECIITLELLAIDSDAEFKEERAKLLEQASKTPVITNDYSQQEIMIQDRIERFFYPTGFVKRVNYQTGFPSD